MTILFRNSRMEVFCKKAVLKNFAKFTGKHLYWACNLSKKEKPTQVFPCDFFLKNRFFTEHIRWLLLFALIFIFPILSR